MSPKRKVPSDSDNSVPVSVEITFDPAFSSRWGYKRTPRVFVGGKNTLPGRWDMSRRKPIKEFPTAAKKTTFASNELRYTSQWTESGSAPASRRIRRQRFIIICRGEPFVVLFRYMQRRNIPQSQIRR